MKAPESTTQQSALLPRRDFVKTLALTGACVAAGLPALAQQTGSTRTTGKFKLGLDNFSVRAMGWKAPALIDYAASLKTDSLFISDLDAFESLQDKHLAEIKARAADRGLQLHLGTWSICATSKSFKDKWGIPEEH